MTTTETTTETTADTAADTATTDTANASEGAEGTKGYAPEHSPRLDMAKLAPEVYKAMVRLDAAARRGVDPTLLELVKIRASQLNHCAFCLDMHSKDALAAGESVERIIQLSAWEESRHFYTPKEIAAIELTEAVTVLTDGFVPDEVYERAAAHFDETELAHLISAITVINAWNRFGVTTRMAPGHYTPGQFKH
ncbi:carboxymuconolactone decarboxylase family protein [Streptomyces sp. NPDC056937]|uniref:carboxymuconolactone decarboxylase family protein n=2 Tax=unclassified Streptomyces TaxID=2593676 RepID=UPI003630C349